MSTFGESTVINTIPNQAIRKILCSWSRTLELDQTSGESIVTETDLQRLTRVLSDYSATDRNKAANIPLFHHSRPRAHHRR